MVEKMGLIKAFLFTALSWSFAQIFQTILLASKTKSFILALSPLLAPSPACFKAWKSNYS